MKVCPSCKEEKELTEFGKDKSRKSGVTTYCKVCSRKRDREKHKKYREKRLAKSKEYYKKHKGTMLEASKQYREEHEERYKANMALQLAVRQGKIVRPTVCERCGDEDGIVGHHDDYSKVLEVQWLCHSCHRLVHREMKKK